MYRPVNNAATEYRTIIRPGIITTSQSSCRRRLRQLSSFQTTSLLSFLSGPLQDPQIPRKKYSLKLSKITGLPVNICVHCLWCFVMFYMFVLSICLLSSIWRASDWFQRSLIQSWKAKYVCIVYIQSIQLPIRS